MKFFDNLWVRQPPEIPSSPQVPVVKNTLPSKKSIAQTHSNWDTITTIGITATGIILGLGGSYLTLQYYSPKPIPPVTSSPSFSGIPTKALTFLGVSTLLYYLARRPSVSESKKSYPFKPQDVSAVLTSSDPSKKITEVTKHRDVNDSASQSKTINPLEPKAKTTKTPNVKIPLQQAGKGKLKKHIANNFAPKSENEDIKKLKEMVLNYITKKDNLQLSAYIRMVASFNDENKKKLFCEALIQLLTECPKTGEVYSTAGDYLHYCNENLNKNHKALNFDVHHKKLIQTLTNCIKDQFGSENENMQEDFGNSIYGAFQVLLRIDDDAALKIARICILFQNNGKYFDLTEIAKMHNSYSVKGKNNLEYISTVFINKFLKLKKHKLIIDCMDYTKYCEDVSNKYNEWVPKDFLYLCDKPVLTAFLKACARLDCEKYKKFQLTIVDGLCDIFINKICFNNSFRGDQKIDTAKQILAVFVEEKNYEMIYNLVVKLTDYFTFKTLFDYLKEILKDDCHELFQRLNAKNKTQIDQLNACLNHFKDLLVQKNYVRAARHLKIFQKTWVGEALINLKEEMLSKDPEAAREFDKEFIKLEYEIINIENTSNADPLEVVYQTIEYVKDTALNYIRS